MSSVLTQLVSLTVLSAAARVLSSYVHTRRAQVRDHELRRALFERTIWQPFCFFDTRSHNALVELVTPHSTFGFLQHALAVVGAAVKCLVLVGVLASLSLKATLLTAIFFPAYALLLEALVRVPSEKAERVTQRDASMTREVVAESFSLVRTVKVRACVRCARTRRAPLRRRVALAPARPRAVPLLRPCPAAAPARARPHPPSDPTLSPCQLFSREAHQLARYDATRVGSADAEARAFKLGAYFQFAFSVFPQLVLCLVLYVCFFAAAPAAAAGAAPSPSPFSGGSLAAFLLAYPELHHAFVAVERRVHEIEAKAAAFV